MFEKFTERARQVVVLAQEEARALKHNYIGTEHLLLGMMREQEGMAAVVLESMGLTVERVRAQVIEIVSRGEELTSGQIPFTPRAKKVLELALREALALGHNWIGTEHILLGLIRENEGVAVRVLLDFDADAEKVRNVIIRRLSDSEVTISTRPTGESDPVVQGLDPMWLDGLGLVLERLANEIRARLRRDPDAGDLLLALACAPGTLPADALEALGVDLDALWGALEHARGQAISAREQAAEGRQRLRDQLDEVRLAKEQAIAAQEFERAAGLRDRERQILEEQSRPEQTRAPETLRVIRQRLGFPETGPSSQPPPS